MVQKLVARIGRSTDIPVLLVGELGMDVDVLVARFGDGSPAAPRIMTDKSSGNFEYLSIEYVKYPQIQMVAGGTVDGVDISELNSANGFLIRNGNNSWSHRLLTNTDGWFDILNGDGTVGNPVINASSTLVSLLTTPYLSSVAHDSTLTGSGTVAVPLSVTPASTTQLGAVNLATQAEVNAGLLTNKPVTPATLAGRVASETLTGLVELATQVEVDLGTDTTRALTPAGLNSKTATDTRRGVVELATQAEVNTGTDTTRVLTPATLAGRTASDTQTGLIELATNAEVLTATDTTRAVTPAGLAAYFVANPSVSVASQAEVNTGIVTNKYVAPNTLNARIASQTLTGLIELATQAEVNAGTDTVRSITPATLAGAFADASRKASQVEVDAGSVVNKYVAPNTLAARTATDIRTGLIALATQGEADALVNSNKAITPATLYGRKATNAEALAGLDDSKYITSKQLKDYSGGGSSFRYPSILSSWPGMGGSADDIYNTTLATTPLAGNYVVDVKGRFYNPSVFQINLGGVWVFLGGIGGPLVGNRAAQVRFTVDSSLRVFNEFSFGYYHNMLSAGAVWDGQVRVTLITVDNAWPSSMELSKMLSY